MSKTQLQTNNAKLEALITELQGKVAGSGSSGSLDTCTIVINNEIASQNHGLYAYAFTTVENGAIKAIAYDGAGIAQSTYTFENVLCGSIFYFSHGGYDFYGVTYTDNISNPSGAYLSGYITLAAPTEAGAIGTITFYDDD